MARAPRPDGLVDAPAFISRQTRSSHHYYLNLSPGRCRDIVVVCGGLEHCRADYLVDRSDFPFLVVEFVIQGKGEVKLGGTTHALRPGTAFAYFARAAHVIRTDPRCLLSKYYVALAGDVAERLVRKSALGAEGVVSVARPAEIVAIYDLLAQYAANSTPYSARLCNALIPVLILKIAEAGLSSGVDGEGYPTYQLARELIRTRFLEFATLNAVAAACGISVFYLCRLFKRFDQETGYRFLMRTKMNHAAELLAEPRSQVNAVAARLGYNDAFQFSRVFKRVHGISPGHFKRMQS
ncbi:AraC family transcriptional regulator [Fimbriiglobus ruber]|uniref:Transcriptional regulator, AraC family n=1 Tax=Fimbriiglobus ruber TaxID=1908690 RepID=A0A225DDF4_9BACT|nr:AraC family transcriptional regulator [Fimbriiglobus ruber]OWK36548.1 Transcriptional regulator, AraC family [Fimbriiglobus ruber]